MHRHDDDAPIHERKSNTSLTRRQLLSGGAALGMAGTLLAGCSRAGTPDALSDDVLIGASALSGEPLPRERVRAQKSLLEFNLKHLRVLREFDPDEEMPLTMFRL